jgi:hypothetical protein
VLSLWLSIPFQDTCMGCAPALARFQRHSAGAWTPSLHWPLAQGLTPRKDDKAACALFSSGPRRSIAANFRSLLSLTGPPPQTCPPKFEDFQPHVPYVQFAHSEGDRSCRNTRCRSKAKDTFTKTSRG